MATVNTHYGFCAKGGTAVKFTYTGEYNVRDDGVVELLTSGDITFLSPAVIDIFCVGGGGMGNICRVGLDDAGGGGAGGTTRTIKAKKVSGQYLVTIGQGATSFNVPGGTTSFGDLVAASGGNAGHLGTSITYRDGNGGGSGGGGGAINSASGGTGGSDGENGTNSSGKGGVGQGATTREFGESNGKLYAGGGGGGRYLQSNSPVTSNGGSGGGGSGAWAGSVAQGSRAAAAGVANTGGGGGGGVTRGNVNIENPGAGGSGIVCFREAK